MPPQQYKTIEEAKFTYSPLGKALEKQSETIEVHVKNQVKVSQFLDLNNQQIQPYQPQTRLIEDIFPKDQSNQEATN